MYKKKSIFAITILLLLLINSFTLSYAGERKDESLDSKFKLVGYYSGDLFDEPLENLQTDKLTHVVYAFLIPKVDGTLVDLQKPQQLRDLVAQAHSDGAEVFIALGGWSYEGEQLEPVFREVAASDETRGKLVENVCAFVEEYNLDGVELDWEHPNTNTIDLYEKLTIELHNALVCKAKLDAI